MDTKPDGTIPELLTITFIVSACSLLYELLIAQTLSLLAGNTVVWYSLTVGAYLGAMGIGAALVKPRSRMSGWSSLFGVELLRDGGVVGHVGKEHGDRLSLALERASGGEDFFGQVLRGIRLGLGVVDLGGFLGSAEVSPALAAE